MKGVDLVDVITWPAEWTAIGDVRVVDGERPPTVEANARTQRRKARAHRKSITQMQERIRVLKAENITLRLNLTLYKQAVALYARGCNIRPTRGGPTFVWRAEDDAIDEHSPTQEEKKG